MGLGSLFGRGGYNEKTFEKNTRIFMDRIQDMMRRCSGNYGVGDMLPQVITALGQSRYQPGWSAEKIEAVDNRIFKLLDQMMSDVQRGQNAKLSAHASMMLEAVTESRSFGEEKLGATELATSERIAEIFAFMEEIAQQKVNTKAEMDKIYEQSKKLSDDDPRLDLLDSKYAQYEERLRALDERYAELREEYAAQIEESELFADKEFYQQIPKDITSPAQLESAIKDVARMRGERTRIRSEKTDMLRGYKKDKLADLSTSSTASTSGLRAKREAEKAASVSGAIDGASAPRSGLRARRDN